MIVITTGNETIDVFTGYCLPCSKIQSMRMKCDTRFVILRKKHTSRPFATDRSSGDTRREEVSKENAIPLQYAGESTVVPDDFVVIVIKSIILKANRTYEFRRQIKSTFD